MKTHHFTLVIDGPDLQTAERAEALFEEGCDDALIGRVDGVQYLEFDREGETAAEAVLSATSAVERAVPGAKVVHVKGGNDLSRSCAVEQEVLDLLDLPGDP